MLVSTINGKQLVFTLQAELLKLIYFSTMDQWIKHEIIHCHLKEFICGVFWNIVKVE